MPPAPTDGATASTAVMEGREVVVFGGCNYLGLAQHPVVVAAARDAMTDFGLSSSASRETTGNAAPHERAERELARFTGFERVVIVPEGYTANITACQALASDHRVAVIDEGSHASVHDAARAAGMAPFVYDHLDAVEAVRLAFEHRSRGVAVLTDGLFAGEGAVAPVRELLAALPDEAAVVVDDCHGLGTIGPRGRGTRELLDLHDPRLVMTSTLAKGMGCYGGMVAGTAGFEARARRANAYYCTTPAPPALAEAVCAAVRVHESDRDRLMRLRRNGELLRAALSRNGIATTPRPLPVFTFTLGSDDAMQAAHAALLERGILLPLIEYPGLARGRHFRVSVTADHTPDQIALLDRELGTALAELRCGVAHA